MKVTMARNQKHTMNLCVLCSAYRLLLTLLASLPIHKYFQSGFMSLFSLLLTHISWLDCFLIYHFQGIHLSYSWRRLCLGIPPKYVPSFILTHTSTLWFFQILSTRLNCSLAYSSEWLSLLFILVGGCFYLIVYFCSITLYNSWNMHKVAEQTKWVSFKCGAMYLPECRGPWRRRNFLVLFLFVDLIRKAEL